MTDPIWPALSPWLLLAGLGAFHGLNPAMGWLFAVALGLHRGSRRVVFWALGPIALGHAVSIGLAAALLLAFGFVADQDALATGAGALLIGWAGYHLAYGHRGRVRVGMTAGFAGLALWSFLMATAHGAGLMLAPAVMSLCLSDGPAKALTASGSATMALGAVATHTGAMLLVTGAVAWVVYDWAGLAFLRRGWINLDWIWAGALAAAGLTLILS